VGLALGYFLVLEVMLVVAIEFWPDFQKMIGPFQLIAKFPVLKNWVDLLRDGGLPAYIVFQHFFKGCNLLGTAAAVLFAVSAIAGEAHRGTLEVLLARPQSRTRLLLTRWSGGALILVVPVLLSTWTVPWFLARWEQSLPLEPLMLGAVHQSCMLLAIYASTFFLSTIGRHPVRIAIGVLFFCVLQFALYFLMEATHISFVRLVDPRKFVDIFQTRSLDWQVCGGLLGYTAFALGCSLFAFRRRVP
jgi:ABC-type transport system involved in multi-copper enzyme maturation permease subunit